MISKLPNECLQQIFRDIKDINTLYSIIQVNHTWCENGIIYLWKNPFRNNNLKNQIKIIPILLNFLKENDDDDLLFDYPCLITHLNFDNLFTIVSEFSKLDKNLLNYSLNLMEKDGSLSFIFHNNSDNDIEYSEFSVISLLMLILVCMAKRKANIRWLKLYTESLIIDKENDTELLIEDVFTAFLKFEESKKLFEKLEYLECGPLGYNHPTLKSLSKTCKQLKTIQFQGNFRSIYVPLVSLIENQKNLENLQIFGIKNNSGMWFYEKIIFELFSSLEAVSHSLKRFEISGIELMTDETFEFLGKCKNLEVLRLQNSTISHKNFEWIAKAKLPKLHSLELISNCDGVDFIRQVNPIQGILKNKMIASNLKKLYLRNKFLKNYDLLEVICENCRNLTNFSTQLTANNDILILFKIFENNSKLEEIYLNIYLDLHTVDISDEIIIDLAKYLPERINTVQLELLINCVYYCRIFLENCLVDLKHFYVVMSTGIYTKEYVDCIKKWSEEKGKKIKEFTINYESFGNKIDVVWG